MRILRRLKDALEPTVPDAGQQPGSGPAMRFHMPDEAEYDPDDLDALRSLFLGAAAEVWHRTEMGGLIEYSCPEQGCWSLSIIFHRELGFLFWWEVGTQTSRQEWHSAWDKARMNEWVHAYLELAHPVGGFMPAEQAWVTVGSFVRSPTTPEDLRWFVRSGDIDWNHPDYEV